MDSLMPAVSALGNGGMIWLISAALLLCFKKYRRYGILLLFGLAAGVLAGNLFLKNLIARPRPCWLDSTVQLLIQSPSDYSFPSGHTCAAFAAGLAWAGTCSARWARIAAVVSAVCMGLSRLYVGVHYPSDVLAGALVGSLAALRVIDDPEDLSGERA